MHIPFRALLRLASVGIVLHMSVGTAFALQPDHAASAGWLTNGTVSAMAVDGTTAYVGGSFTMVGPRTGAASVVDAASGTRIAARTAEATGGSVLAAVGDGDGGWFLGGTFTAVAGVARPGLAHVRADGSLDAAWNPLPNGAVNALARSGPTLYFGGAFTSVSGLMRNRLAAVSTTGGGGPTDWDPNASGTVSTLLLDGSTLYAGGAFVTIGGAARSRIAALDTTVDTGMATSWNPSANNTVATLRLTGTTLYAGGAFTSIGGVTRNRVAALDTTLDTANALAFNPNSQGAVTDLALAGSSVYLAGVFTSMGGQSRAFLAEVDAITGVLSPWNPSPNSAPTALEADGSLVYVGGVFVAIASQPRSGLAAFDAATGALTAWDPTAIGTVLELVLDGSDLMVGGAITSVNAVRRSRLAAIDLVSGAATDWDPQPNNIVNAIDVLDGTVYVGGIFTALGVTPRNRIAAISAASGEVSIWNPSASSTVSAIEATREGIYAGGLFTSIGLQARNRVARLRVDTGLADGWNPDADNAVGVLVASVEGIYIGGSFTNIGGVVRSRLARLDTVSGAADGWNPGASSTVSAIAVDPVRGVYVGGAFTAAGGATRSRLARIDSITALAHAWNPNPNNLIAAIALGRDNVFIGGAFTSAGGQARGRIAVVDADQDTGNLLDWNPNASTTVNVLTAIDDGDVLVGGAMTSFATPVAAQTYLAYFAAAPDATQLPRIAGSGQVGTSLRCDTGDWTGLPHTYAYAWYVGATRRDDESAGAYVVRVGDVGRQVRCQVTAANIAAAASDDSASVTALPLAPTAIAKPSIAGTARVGEILSCVGGGWRGVFDSITYRWYVDAYRVSGAMGSTFQITPTHVGARIECGATASNAGGATSVRSAEVSIRALGPRLLTGPRLRVIARAGAVLSCPSGTWDDLVLTRTVRWLRDGNPIARATTRTLRTTRSMVGRSVTCQVTAYGAGGKTTVRSTPARVIPARQVGLRLAGGRLTNGTVFAMRGAALRAAGRVLDDGGRPVRGAVVRIEQGSAVIAVAVTDARGRYTVRLLARASGEVRARVSPVAGVAIARTMSPQIAVRVQRQ